LQKRETSVHNPVPQSLNVKVESRCARVVCRLTHGEQEVNLSEQIVSKPYQAATFRINTNTRDAPGGCLQRDGIRGSIVECRQGTVNRNTRVSNVHSRAVLARGDADTVRLIDGRRFGAVNQKKPGRGFGYVLIRHQDNVVLAIGLVVFPGSLEELEEFLNDRGLIPRRQNSN